MTEVFVAVVIGVAIHYTPLATMALASAHNQRGENRRAYNRLVNPAQHKNALNYLPSFNPHEKGLDHLLKYGTHKL